ncbi:MAG: 23S rRNA pseudouridine(955/2504/2580) synthase RluC [Halioglobus sp.]
MASEEREDSHSGGVRHVTVDEEASGQRLDNFLLKHARGVPKTRIYRALRKGEVRVNKGRARADYRIVAGDLVRIPPLHQASKTGSAAAPERMAQQILRQTVHEDDDLLVVNKPSGLAVHGGSGLSFGLIETLRKLRPEARYLELVHRLDRDTSGLILIAKRAAILRELHRQLREKHIDKRYLALVAGHWPQRQVQVEAPLEKNVVLSGERMVRVSKEGKRALTQFKVVERYAHATLIEARPITGRTHQIRVHALHAGFPLLGDSKYENARSAQLTRELGLKRLFLHAASLRFTLPERPEMQLEAELESTLKDVLRRARK